MALGTAIGLREGAASSIRFYFEAAADRIGLHTEMRRLLSVPFRELTVELPLRRDDERLQLFRGYRIQHNSVRGPVIGPMRVQPELDMETLRADAESTTWRCAVANVPFGGGAGGVSCDSAQLSRRELERLIRRYTARVHHVLGVYQDVCAPGMNAGADVMAWIADEYSALHVGNPPVALGMAGQPGGFPDHQVVVGRAIAGLILRVARDQGKHIAGLRAAVQSLDQSAIHTALALAQAGCVLVGIAEERGGRRCPAGLDVDALARQLRRDGTLGDGDSMDNFCSIDCDVLAISAVESTMNLAAARSVQARTIIETSPLVVTAPAEQYLISRGVLLIPDLVGAAGYVLAANAEWSSNLQKACPKPELLQREIEMALVNIYQQAQDRSVRDRVSLRVAAYCSAIERVARSEHLRVA
jgi:glutamate dehydrogenase (NAD(P)+)